MNPEILLDQPSDLYHQSEGISKHDLDLVNISPAHYKAAKEAPRDEPTTAMQIGTLVHTAILEPHNFEGSFTVAPDCDKRTKDGKAAWEAAEKDASLKGSILVKSADLAMVRRMAEQVSLHRSAKAALEAGGLVEASLYADCPETKVRRRGRPDLISRGNVIIDIKTCAKGAGGRAEFAKSVANWRYDVQAAYYLDLARDCGHPKEGFVFIVVEKEAPYAVAVYQLDLESIEAGRRQYKRNLQILSECLEFDEWPAYSSEVEVISLPKWKLNQIEEVAA